MQLFYLFFHSPEQHAPTPKRQPGEMTDRTVLNVFGPMGQGGRYILDSLKVSEESNNHYSWIIIRIKHVLSFASCFQVM